MAIDTERIAKELDRWLFELDEYAWAEYQRRRETRKHQRAGESETGEADSQESDVKPRKVRITPKDIHRFL